MSIRDLSRFIHFNDDNTQILGYNLYREDHPVNVKRGDVCIY